MLEVIDEESDRLNRFVEGLIELARIEAGELRLRLRWGAVDEVVAAALARAEPLTRDHPVSVELEDELPAVRVDPHAVAEVVYTLVDNAAKYSPPGTAIRVAAGRAEGEMLRIAVEDEGQGIPADLRERVFDKFFRATRDGDAGGGHSPAGTGWGSPSPAGSSRRTAGASGPRAATVVRARASFLRSPSATKTPRPTSGRRRRRSRPP